MSEAMAFEGESAQVGGVLSELRDEMRRAFLEGRWQDLADLDAECRQHVTRVIETKDPKLFDLLTDTLRFYRQLLDEFQVAKSNLSSEVMQLRRAQSRNQVYRQMSVVR